MIGKSEAAEAARRAPHLPPGEPGEPRLVERLDGGPDYYLVPWETPRGTAGLVLIDAGSGGVLGVTLSPEPGPSPLLEPIPGARLVWKPCQESTSPSRPFYEVVRGGRAGYVDMSGRELDRLTPLGRG